MLSEEKTDEIVFDNCAKTYKKGLKNTLKVSGFSPNYFHNYKVKELFGYLKKNNLERRPIKILDFGCGVGCSEPYLSHYFPQAQIYACDISDESIKCAVNSNKRKNTTFATFEAENLPFEEKFDVIFVANVFHHIPRKKQQGIINMLKSSLNPNGFIIIFEHNPYNLLTDTLALLTDFRYDKNTNLLTPVYMKKILKNAGFTKFECNYRIFFPGFLRMFVPFEKYIRKCPLGAHYFYIAS